MKVLALAPQAFALREKSWRWQGQGQCKFDVGCKIILWSASCCLMSICIVHSSVQFL